MQQLAAGPSRAHTHALIIIGWTNKKEAAADRLARPPSAGEFRRRRITRRRQQQRATHGDCVCRQRVSRVTPGDTTDTVSRQPETN